MSQQSKKRAALPVQKNGAKRRRMYAPLTMVPSSQVPLRRIAPYQRSPKAMKDPFPPKMFTSLTNYFTLKGTVTTTAVNQLRTLGANDMPLTSLYSASFPVDAGTGGRKPRYVDELSRIYKKYRVHGVVITYQVELISSPADTGAYIALGHAPSGQNVGNPLLVSDSQESSRILCRRLYQRGSGRPYAVISKYYNIKQIEAEATLDKDYEGTTLPAGAGTPPASVPSFQLMVGGDEAGEYVVSYTLKMVSYVEWNERPTTSGENANV